MSHKFKDILERIIDIYTFLHSNYRNNLIVCTTTKMEAHKKKYIEDEKFSKMRDKEHDAIKKAVLDRIKNNTPLYHNQFEKVKKTDLLSDTKRDKFVKSFNFKNKIMSVNNGIVKIFN